MHFPIDFPLKDIIRDVFRFLLLNTMENRQEGMTYYDLKKFANIPASKIYRMMKNLEREGILRVEERIEFSRPKHIYFMTERGIKLKKDLQKRIQRLFDALRETQETDINYENFFKLTFHNWRTPIGFIIESKLPIDEKLKRLDENQKHHEKILREIKNAKRKLEKKKKEL